MARPVIRLVHGPHELLLGPGEPLRDLPLPPEVASHGVVVVVTVRLVVVEVRGLVAVETVVVGRPVEVGHVPTRWLLWAVLMRFKVNLFLKYSKYYHANFSTYNDLKLEKYFKTLLFSLILYLCISNLISSSKKFLK